MCCVERLAVGFGVGEAGQELVFTFGQEDSQRLRVQSREFFVVMSGPEVLVDDCFAVVTFNDLNGLVTRAGRYRAVGAAAHCFQATGRPKPPF